MLDLNIKNAANILTNKDNQVVASNKSKAKLSVIDKIRSFYYQRRIDVIDVKVEDLEYNQKVFSDDMKRQEEKLEQISSESNIDELSKINDDYLEDQKNIEEINEQLEDLNEQKEEYQGKLNEINAKLEPIEPEVTPIKQNDSVSEEMVESAMKKAEEELKNDVESMNMEQVTEETKKSPIKQIIAEYEVRDNELFSALIERIEKTYDAIINESLDKMQAEANKMLTEANNTIITLNGKVESLTNELSSTKQILEQTNNELVQTKGKVSEQEQTIMDLKISANAKDEEINAKDAEIARLRPFEETINMMKNSMNQVVAQSEEHSKTL